MMKLSELSNTHRPTNKVQRVGRGMGSKRGKTSGRGIKGDKSRRGYQNRFGQEGGRTPLYKKLPTRGFSNARFKSEVFAINLGSIEKLFENGETVNLLVLQEMGIAPRRINGGLKILSHGELSKKVKIEATSYSQNAIEKLNSKGITYQIVQLNEAS